MPKAKNTTKEFEFFLEADLEKYKGEYIAIIGKKIAAHGKDAKKTWEQARKKFPTKLPTIAKIPHEEALVLIWLKE